METEIIDTNPLMIKFIYNQFIRSSANHLVEITNDSTIIKYDFRKNKYHPIYENTKLNKEQIYSHFLLNNELNFINSYYSILKNLVENGNPEEQRTILEYLNLVKNQIN